jgi:hypothetical protein
VSSRCNAPRVKMMSALATTSSDCADGIGA